MALYKYSSVPFLSKHSRPSWTLEAEAKILALMSRLEDRDKSQYYEAKGGQTFGLEATLASSFHISDNCFSNLKKV